MPKLMRKHTEEFKQEAMKLALQKPSISGAAQDLGIPAATLHTWIYKLKGKQPLIPSSAQETSVDIKALLEENR